MTEDDKLARQRFFAISLLRLAGVDVPEAGTLIGSCTGVGGALAANLVRQREAARLRRPAVVPVERGSR